LSLTLPPGSLTGRTNRSVSQIAIQVASVLENVEPNPWQGTDFIPNFIDLSRADLPGIPIFVLPIPLISIKPFQSS
jgi:hypothetical protein